MNKDEQMKGKRVLFKAPNGLVYTTWYEELQGINKLIESLKNGTYNGSPEDEKRL